MNIIDNRDSFLSYFFFFFLRQNFCVTNCKGSNESDQSSGICHSALVISKEKMLEVASPQEDPTHHSQLQRIRIRAKIFSTLENNTEIKIASDITVVT